MSTFTKIKAIKKSLSHSEGKLADFILNSPNAIRELSSQELANVAGVSQSSVVKFTQKLGYKGYPTFKLAVMDALNSEAINNEQNNEHLHGKITLSDSLEQLAAKLLRLKKVTNKMLKQIIEKVLNVTFGCLCVLKAKILFIYYSIFRVHYCLRCNHSR